jgi:hypothetical protein
VHRLLVDALLDGPHRPAVLLLSATPYRLRRLSGEDIHPVERYRALIDLARFLNGEVAENDVLNASMQDYHDGLRAGGERDEIVRRVLAAKERIEAVLRPVVARTERALVYTEDLFDRPKQSVAVETADLEVFRHFAHAVAVADPKLKGWAPVLWGSVPYPTQTLHG